MDEHKARFWQKIFPGSPSTTPPVFREGGVTSGGAQGEPPSCSPCSTSRSVEMRGKGDGDEILACYLKQNKFAGSAAAEAWKGKKFLQVVELFQNMANAMTWIIVDGGPGLPGVASTIMPAAMRAPSASCRFMPATGKG